MSDTLVNVPATLSGSATPDLTRPSRPMPPPPPARRNILLYVAVGWLGLIVLLAVLAPLLPLKDPTVQVAGTRVLPFHSWSEPLGTDRLGRSVLSRLIYGARPSLGIGFTAAAIGMIIGGIAGLLAGYYGRFLDTAIGPHPNTMRASPPLIFLLALAAIVGPSVPMMIFS